MRFKVVLDTDNPTASEVQYFYASSVFSILEIWGSAIIPRIRSIRRQTLNEMTVNYLNSANDFDESWSKLVRLLPFGYWESSLSCRTREQRLKCINDLPEVALIDFVKIVMRERDMFLTQGE